MRYCFIIDTPYQLFCVLNIVYDLKNSKSRDNDIYDLYIGTNFNQSDKILENVRNEKIFDNVYRFSCNLGKVKAGDFLRYFFKLVMVSRNERKLLDNIAKAYSRKTMAKFLVIKRFMSVEQMAFGKGYDLDSPYEKIFASYYNPFVRNMALLSSNAEISCFEDGSGSYSESMFDYANQHEPDRKLAVVGINIEKFKPKKLYVFKPEMCELRSGLEVKELPLFYKKNNQFDRIANQIFDYKKPSLYNGIKTIFLMSREDEISLLGGNEHGDECLQRYNGVVELLMQEHKNVIYRIHPRQKEYDFGEKIIDNTGVMWELLTPDFITKECIIISICSTGAMTPKILYGIEPYIIMIGEYVFSGTDTEKTMTKRIENFKKFYTDKEKIIIIRNEEQLTNCFKIL